MIIINTFFSFKSVLKSAVIALLFCAFTLCASPVNADKSMHIVYPDYWPFFSTNSEGKLTGIFYEIITIALHERMGIDIHWDCFPWKRCQLYVKKGKADAMITVPTTERLAYCRTHPEPFHNKTMNIFTYAGHPYLDKIIGFRTIKDISRSGMSVLTYAGNGWNDKYIRSKRIPTIEAPRRSMEWSMLAHKRGDLIIEWPAGAWPDIFRLGLQDRIIQTDIVLDSMPFHLLIGRESIYIERLKEFEQVISAMQKDGTIQKIMDKYCNKKCGKH